MQNTLSLISVSKQFQQGSFTVNPLQNVSVQFFQGKTYAIIGESGSGKSTLLHILAGLEMPTQGTLLFNDHSIAALSDQERAFFLNRHIGFIFQFPHLITECTALENVMIKGLIAGKSWNLCVQEAQELLYAVGLSAYEERTVLSLSGGQQQRVSLARALMNQPSFLLADEPTAHLDHATAQQIVEIMVSCTRQWGMGIIMNCHDQTIAKIMDVQLQLHNGQLLNCRK